jgi:hypothetical protein
MKQSVLPTVFASVLLVTGCSHLKKNPKPAETTAIAADTDENFRQRFIEKRANELTAQGTAPAAARAQATEEFKTRYEYTSAAKK